MFTVQSAVSVKWIPWTLTWLSRRGAVVVVVVLTFRPHRVLPQPPAAVWELTAALALDGLVPPAVGGWQRVVVIHLALANLDHSGAAAT